MLQTEWAASDTAWGALLVGEAWVAEQEARARLERDPRAVDAWLTLGELSLERQALPQALASFDEVTQYDPDHVDALVLSSVALARGGDGDRAIEFLKRALRTNQVESPVRLTSAKRSEFLTRVAYAIPPKLLESRVGAVVVMGLFRGLTWIVRPVRELPRITTFLAVLDTMGSLERLPARQRPWCLSAHYARYLRIMDEQHADTALAYARRAVRARDHADDAYLTMGIVYEKRRQPNRALRMALKAIELNPRNAEALRWAAFLYAQRGDLLNEYRMIRAAFDAAPHDAFYIRHLDHVLMEKLGDPYQAVELFQRALELNPDNLRAMDRLGYAFGMMGEYEQSAVMYRRALSLDTMNPASHLGLAFALERSGDTEEAIAAYHTAAAVAPDQPEAHTRLASLYHGQRRYREAIAEYEVAFQHGGEEINTLAELCSLYHAVSEFRRAGQCFQKVLEADPRNTLAQRLLPEVLENLRLQSASR
jgi:tetratricopeptide (TPR) repeat protein